MPAPTRPSIRIVRSLPYRGGTKQTGSRYFFTGADPSGSSAWLALANAVTAAEKATIPDSYTTITSAIGYNAGSDVPVYTNSYSLAGTWSHTGTACPGDCASMTKFTTTQRSTKNHPIYLYKYMHPCYASASDPDVLQSTMVTALNTYWNLWLSTGFTVDGTQRFLCGPRGAVAQTALVSTQTRHRDFQN